MTVQTRLLEKLEPAASAYRVAFRSFDIPDRKVLRATAGEVVSVAKKLRQLLESNNPDARSRADSLALEELEIIEDIGRRLVACENPESLCWEFYLDLGGA